MPHRSPTLPESLLAAIRKETPRYENPGIEESSATIASYNIHKCVGTDGRFDPERTSRVVAELDADVIALQEADERTGNRQGLLDLQALEKTANLVLGTYAGQPAQPWLAWQSDPGARRRRARRQAAQTAGSRAARGADRRPRAEGRSAAHHRGASGSAAPIEIVADDRAAQATHSVLRPTILLGDLNEWRVRTRSSLLTLVPHFGPIHAVLPSFPSAFPLLALDRILARPPSLISSIEVHNTPLSRVASDHLPIKARLDLCEERRGVPFHNLGAAE